MDPAQSSLRSSVAHHVPFVPNTYYTHPRTVDHLICYLPISIPALWTDHDLGRISLLLLLLLTGTAVLGKGIVYYSWSAVFCPRATLAYPGILAILSLGTYCGRHDGL